MTTYTPNKWVIVEITYAGEAIKRVLGSWYSGYTNGDSYRLSSGVTRVEDKGDHYLIHNYSGSQYVCYKTANGMSLLAHSVLNAWKKTNKIKVLSGV